MLRGLANRMNRGISRLVRPAATVHGGWGRVQDLRYNSSTSGEAMLASMWRTRLNSLRHQLSECNQIVSFISLDLYWSSSKYEHLWYKSGTSGEAMRASMWRTWSTRRTSISRLIFVPVCRSLQTLSISQWVMQLLLWGFSPV